LANPPRKSNRKVKPPRKSKRKVESPRKSNRKAEPPEPPRKSNRKVEIAERRKLALELARDGNDYETIGRALNCNKTTAWTIVHRALARMVREPADDVRKLELARLDAAWLRVEAAHKTAVLGIDDPVELVAAVVKLETVRLRIMERRAAMTGVDAPKAAPIIQVNVAPPERPNLSALDADDLRTMRQLQAKMLAASDENAITVEAEETKA
jgi:hypothetical protein